MEQFRKILISFLNGELAVEDTRRELAALALSEPDLVKNCLQQLNNLYSKRRLTPQHYSIFRDSITKPAEVANDASVDPLEALDAAAGKSTPAAEPPNDASDNNSDAGKTQFRMPGAPTGQPEGPEATQFRTPTRGSPSQTSGTGYPTGAGYPTSGTGTGFPTGATSSGSSWNSPSAWTGGTGGDQQGPVTVGSVIKDRFVLEKLVGKGGMGMVFKALDLRKQEAQDRFPYVALKILNEEFKKHPESLKALQRESRKAQDLAHPSIVNVFDFDRDHGTVFMTMELLEGTPLDELVRKHKGIGIPWNEALPIIKGMSLALDYAHRKRIIHSDFKPGNCFLTNDGSVKVFDFGIARAAKRTGELKGEETKFDAGTLGALTPAYATCEMIDGDEPDQRDDIYALACSIYELLAGRHPYDKLSAADAAAKGMVPKPIKGLSRSRFKALTRGLALTRQQRTKTAFKLLEELNPRSSNLGLKIGLGSAIVLGLVVTALVLVPNYFYSKKLETLRVGLNSESFTDVQSALDALDQIKPDDRQLLLNSNSDQIIGTFDIQVGKVFNRDSDLYDYPQARALVDQLAGLYSDSSRVGTLNGQIESDRQDLQAQLSADYDGFISARQFLPGEAKNDDIYDLRAIIKKIDPSDQLLSDARLPQALAAEARASALIQDFDNAETFYTIGLELAPEDADLINVRDEVEGQRIAVERADEIAQLEASLQPLGDRRVTMASFEAAAVQKDMQALRELQPDNAALKKAQSNLQRLLSVELDNSLDTRQWSSASERLTAFEKVVSENYMAEQNNEIDSRRRTHKDSISAITSQIDAAIAAGNIDTQGRGSAIALLAQLSSAGADVATINASRDRIASGYLDAARAARSKQDWETARIQAAKAVELKPSADLVSLAQVEVDKVANQETLAEKELMAQEVGNLQTRFGERLAQQAFGKSDIDASLLVLKELQERFASESGVEQFIASGQSRIAQRIAEQSMDLAEAARWDDANSLLVAGEAGLGRTDVLQQTRTQINELQRQKASKALQEQIRNSEESVANLLKAATLDANWKTEFDRQLSALEKLESSNPFAREARERAAAVYLNNARKLREESRWVVAKQQLDNAQELAPSLPAVQTEVAAFEAGQAQYEQQLAQAKSKAEIDAKRETFTRQLKAGRIDRAEAALSELRGLLNKDDPFLTRVAPKALIDGRLDVAADNARLDQYTKAIGQLDEAEQYGVVDSRIAAARAQYQDQRTAYNSTRTGSTDDILSIEKVLPRLQVSMGNGYDAFEQKVQRLMKGRIEDIAVSNRRNAEALFTAAQTPFPGIQISWPVVQSRPAEIVQPPVVKEVVVAPKVEPPRVTVRSGGPHPGTRPCRSSTAGNGRTCVDGLGGNETGPSLVVIPGGGGGNEFAITRDEVSIEDFNFYCDQSKQCARVGGQTKFPVTNISAEQMTAYAAWLSSTTGQRYALPSLEQWRHAAHGGDGFLDPTINCVRRVGGKQAAGFGLAEVNSAKPNSWGLRQIVGNAEEVVSQGGGYVAAGGAWSDRLDDCTVNFTRPFGGASASAGFRLVRNVN